MGAVRFHAYLGGTGDRLYAIPGSPPDLLDPPTGDAFYPRNEFALQIDAEQQPPFFDVSPTHKAATWLLAPQAPKVTPPDEILIRWKKFQEKLDRHLYKGGEPIGESVA